MRKFLLLLLILPPLYSYAQHSKYDNNYWNLNPDHDFEQDYHHYMETDNLLLFGGILAFSGISANTNLDRSINTYWQDNVKSKTSDKLFSTFKTAGDISFFYAPIYLFSMWGGHTLEYSLFYDWGYRSLRTVILGGIQQIVLTNVLGSGRPNQGKDSKWRPFKNQHGVSGHALHGAIPFLTAAQLTTQPILKGTLYAVSTLPGLSRINFSNHYFSQVVLGWSIAFLTSKCVYKTDQENSSFNVTLLPKQDGLMLAMNFRF